MLDYVKKTSILKCSEEALQRIGPAAVTLGEAEGLSAHARSVAMRLGQWAPPVARSRDAA